VTHIHMYVGIVIDIVVIFLDSNSQKKKNIKTTLHHFFLFLIFPTFLHLFVVVLCYSI